MPPVTTQTNNDALQAEIKANPQGEASKARFRRPPVNPSVSANTLANPPQSVSIPQPTVPTQPSQFVQNLDPSIQNANDGVIRAQTEEASSRDNLLEQLMKNDSSSSQNTFNDTFRDNFSVDQQRQREDANLKLAQLQGKFRTQAQDVSGAKGQSKVFEQAQLGELSREEAVQVGNQALLVQALNGNMESARQIALDTANFANQDRQAELDNLLNQYNALDGIVTGQEKQLVDQAKAKALAEKEELQRTQATTDSAILSGGATVEEMQQLTSTTATNQEKLALSQSILARTTGESLALDRRLTNLNIDGASTRNAIAKFEYTNAVMKREQDKLLEESGQYVPTGDEDYTTGGFALRMTNAEQQVRQFEDNQLTKGGVTPTIAQGVAFRASQQLPKELQTQEVRSYLQAQENFITAVLRYESGAVISDHEFVREGNKYFPQPGDGQIIIDQKRLSRENATAALVKESQGGFTDLLQGQSQPIGGNNLGQLEAYADTVEGQIQADPLDTWFSTLGTL